MRVIGMIANSPVVMSVTQLAEHINGKSNRNISLNNLNHCANAILNHPGGNVAGGALNGIQYRGNAIYHESRNLGGPNQACTVFFADSGNGVAKLLAVGAHIGGAPGGHPVYTLDWVSNSWGTQWKQGTQVQL